jgi:hypothetical protein
VVYVVVSSPPATEETGAIGREIESRVGIGFSILVYATYVAHIGLENFRKYNFPKKSNVCKKYF